jgi:hypothetical protein
VSFDWFNIETGAVETVLVPQVDLTVTGEAASADEPLDPANIARMIAWALIGIGIFWTVARLLGPRIADGLAKLRAAWRGSELCAYRAVAEAMRHRDLNSTMAALADWLTFFPQATAVHQGALESALATIGSARYGSGTDGTAVANWSGLRDVYDTTRRQLRALRRTRENDESLPPMNPYST